uniref:VWFD domain-containing protein n=1 Tax=Myripristis murdjan TaxID=586833 RepID=A0A667WTS4_9TELE
MVYNVSDHDGWCYVGFCRDDAGCHDGEVWQESNCLTGICHHGEVIYNRTHCEPVREVVCANGYPPVKIYDKSGCCYQYQCQCICYGWGDPHYVTFDGTYYGFQGNCSYWLVKEILPKYNFSVVIDNYYCGSPDGLSCPQSLTVFYQSYKIFITQKDINGIFTSLIYVNDKQVHPAYQTGDFRITTNGIETLLVIPAIDAKITFTGLIFSIYLPYDKFNHNTEGQCGTCDNNRTDDCMLPNGKIDSSCPHMAHEWRLNNSRCQTEPPPTPPPSPPTCNATICDIISSSVFKECHKVINYEPFIVACKFDVCHMHLDHIGCTSIQTYAEACAEAGVCVAWRNATDGLCDYKCRSPKVYKACGPMVEPTCDFRYNQKFIYTSNEFSALSDVKLEGCYCPPPLILLSATSDECVRGCGKKQRRIYGCEECVCEEDTLQVSCRKVCPPLPPLSCDHQGQVKVTDTSGCCPKEKCGERSVCVCVCVCVGEGEVVHMSLCEECCLCKVHMFAVYCVFFVCVCVCVCVQGYEYQPVPNQCCGKCVQTSCIVLLPNNITHTFKVGRLFISIKIIIILIKMISNNNNKMSLSSTFQNIVPMWFPTAQ